MSAARRLAAALLAAAALALAVGCATVKVPVSRLGPPPFAGRADSIFLSPLLPAAAGGAFRMEKPLEKSRGGDLDYLRVWTSFLRDYLKDAGVRLVTPQGADSLATAAFLDSAAEPDWAALYGVSPGPRSRALVVDSLSLTAFHRSWMVRTGEALGLVDDSRREYGAVVAVYRIEDVSTGATSEPRRLVSRQPDDPYTTNHLDRAGKLMMRAAYDLARDLSR